MGKVIMKSSFFIRKKHCQIKDGGRNDCNWINWRILASKAATAIKAAAIANAATTKRRE